MGKTGTILANSKKGNMEIEAAVPVSLSYPYLQLSSVCRSGARFKHPGHELI